MSPVRGLLLLPAVLVLTGCAGGPESALHDDVAAVVEAGNDRDADRLRLRADELMQTVEAQASAGDLTPDRAEQLRTLAASVRTHADVIDAELLEREREAAEAEAERKRLEEERARLEAERKQLEEDRKSAEEEARRQAEEEAKKDEEKKGEGEGKKNDDDD